MLPFCQHASKKLISGMSTRVQVSVFVLRASDQIVCYWYACQSVGKCVRLARTYFGCEMASHENASIVEDKEHKI